MTTSLLTLHRYFFAWLLLIASGISAQPTITSFSPASGPVNSSVILTGSNFDAVLLNNIVYFGAVRANVTDVSATTLTVAVPAGATYQPISVLNSSTDLTGYSNRAFATTFTNPFGNTIPSGFYQPKVDFATGTLPYSVVLGDLDNDSKPDMVVANYSSNTISVFHNRSTNGTLSASSFAAPIEFTTGVNPFTVAIGDVNNDGKPDLVVTNQGASTVSVFRNNSVGGTISASSFAAKVDFATGAYPFSVAIGDVDGDGKPDIVTANSLSNDISIIHNLTAAGSLITTASFEPKVDVAAGNYPRYISVVDIDGDGDAEILVVNQNSRSIDLLYINSYTGNIPRFLVDARVTVATGTNPSSIALGDVDGDGKPDVVVGNVGSNTVSVLHNITTPGGSMTDPAFDHKTDFMTGTQPFHVTLGDVNGDGQPDIITANAGSNSISVLRNTAVLGSVTATSFAAKVDFATGGYPVWVTAGDLDGDGVPETITANATGSVSVLKIGAPTSIVVSSFSPASGPVGTTVTISGTNFNAVAANNIVYFGAVKATVTGGSATSLTVTVPAGATYQPISVLNTGTGLTAYSSKPYITSFNNPYGSGIPAGFYRPKVDFTTGALPYSVATGDLDGDGKPDMVTANFNSNTISILRNTSATGNVSASSFTAKADITTGTNPYAVIITDVDGNGKPDIIVANYGTGSVSVFRNIAVTGSLTAASFAAKVDFSLGSAYPFSIAAGDLDGDGKPDLVVTNSPGNVVSVLRNTSVTGAVTASSFAAKVDFATGAYPRSVAIGDIDGDGRPDLVVANQNAGTVSVLRNTAVAGSINTFSFAGKIDFAVGIEPLAIAIGDLDADDKPDIAVANHGSNTVSVLHNVSGNGTIDASSFADKTDFATGTQPFAIAIGDADGDVMPDLVVANAVSNTVSVLRNITDPGTITTSSFAGKADFATGGYPVWVTVGDLDGDGIAEITTANAAGSVSVLKLNPPVTAAMLQPVVTSVAPPAGPVGTSVTISGANFNATAASNIVYFGAVRAAVTSGSTTGLTVTAPAGATYQAVSVLNAANGLTGYAAKPYITTFTNPFSTGIPAGYYLPPVNYGTGNYPASVSVSDIDGDGKADLLVANLLSGTISVLRNISVSGNIDASSFAPKVDFTIGTSYSIATGDVDGDGKPDLVAVNYNSNVVSVMRNTAAAGSITASSFAAKVDFATGTSPNSVAISDVDGDGRPDLVVSNRVSNSLSVLRNTAARGMINASSFAARVDFLLTGEPNSVAVGDIDGDGKADLVCAYGSGDSVSVLRNTSVSGTVTSSSFDRTVNFAADGVSVAVSDLDGDGKKDIITGSAVLQNISSAGSISAASFSDKISLDASGAVTIGDIDGDGKPDIITTSTVLRNTTIPGSIDPSSFSEKLDLTTGSTPVAVAVGDLDNDGITELAIAITSAGISVYKVANPQPGVAGLVLKQTGSAGSVMDQAARSIQLYPNPANDAFTLQLLNFKPGTVTVDIFNEAGKTVQRRSLTLAGQSAYSTMRLSIPGQPAGVYYVKVTGVDGVQVMKVVLQR